MQYELFDWERRVFPQEEYMKESERIRAAFVSVLLSGETDATLERYVRMHQSGILQLSKEVKLKDGMVSCLDSLSAFLEQHASRYLHPDLPLPFFRSQFFQGFLRENSPFVRERLQAVDPQLSDLVLALLKEPDLTYRKWFPLKDLVEYILQWPKEAPLKNDQAGRLLEMLYCLNVNTAAIFRYIQTTIEGEFPEARRLVDWQEHKPGYQFVEGRVSLTRMLSSWLEEQTRNGEEQDNPGFGLDSKKVITSLTVNELGLLVRLFMETGVFRTRNRMGLARFMAQNVVTLKKEAVDKVSSNHLYGTIYSVNDATMDSVQAILNRMLVRLGKLRLEQRQKKK